VIIISVKLGKRHTGFPLRDITEFQARQQRLFGLHD
jgi:hypothetical protein